MKQLSRELLDRANRNVELMIHDEESDWPDRVLWTLQKLDDHPGLSVARLRVLVCASHGLGLKETASVLGVSAETVKTELTQARRALAAKNTVHAVARAIRAGVIA